MQHQLVSSRAAGIFCLLVSLIGLAQGELKLDSLCSGSRVSLTKISEVRGLIEESKSSKTAACEKFKESLVELDDILAQLQTGQICNLDFVDKIRVYHEMFIASSNNKARDNIPKSLRHFFISLCFQVSARCKAVLINDLEIDTEEVISESDYDEIKLLEGYGMSLFDYDTKIKDFDDILLLKDLHSATGTEEESSQQRLLIKVKTNNRMRKLVANCNNKFKPFYEKLIMPLVKLSNLGYNYQGDLIERELEELNRNHFILRWYNIVQTCEAFGAVEIYEDPEVTESSEGRKAITFISPEEAKFLHDNNVKTIEEEIAQDKTTSNEKIVYDPVIEHKDDELWIKDQREIDKLDKLVTNYKSSKTEVDRIRSKFFKKLMAKLKETIMSGKVLMLAQDLVKTGSNSDTKTETQSINEEFIMMMDETVKNDEIAKCQASPDACESPVAGIENKAGANRRFKRGITKVPPKPKLILRTKDGTKTTIKVRGFLDRLLPRKMDMFMFMLFISGFLLIFICIFAG